MKHVIITFVIGAIIGAVCVYIIALRPANIAIDDLERQSADAERRYNSTLAEYSDLLATTRSRVRDLTNNLDAETAAHRRATDRANRAESRVRELEDLESTTSASNNRALELNRRIRDEAQWAIGALRSESSAP